MELYDDEYADLKKLNQQSHNNQNKQLRIADPVKDSKAGAGCVAGPPNIVMRPSTTMKIDFQKAPQQL